MTRPQTFPAVGIALAAAAAYTLMWVGYSQDWHWQQRMDSALSNAARDSAVKHL